VKLQKDRRGQRKDKRRTPKGRIGGLGLNWARQKKKRSHYRKEYICLHKNISEKMSENGLDSKRGR